MNKKYKVLFFGGGIMGQLARGVLEGSENVDMHECINDCWSSWDGENPDLIFSASYPSRIPQDMVKITALGAVNIHTSLLPEGRGSNPLNWALIWGKQETGITIHKIVDTYDAGDICLQQEIPIFDTDNIVRLRERVEALFPSVIQRFFTAPEEYIGSAWKQNQAHASYAQKRLPDDSELNLDGDPIQVYNLFRSCDPEKYPAFVRVGDDKVIVENVIPDNYEVIYKKNN